MPHLQQNKRNRVNRKQTPPDVRDSASNAPTDAASTTRQTAAASQVADGRGVRPTTRLQPAPASRAIAPPTNFPPSTAAPTTATAQQAMTPSQPLVVPANMPSPHS